MESYMKLPLIAGALAVVAATAAFAGDPVNTTTTADPKATFKSLDTDGNGRISAAEARAHHDLNAGYQGAVSDSEKGMSMAEFEAWASSQKPATMPPSN
jgi:hypothetical protein